MLPTSFRCTAVGTRNPGSARAALASTGFGEVQVVTDDGTRRLAADSYFDRVIATAAVQDVPPAWVAQTCPGGRIVTPWTTTFVPGDCSP